MIRADKSTSDYYIHGFSQLDDDTARWAIVAGMASTLCDAALFDLFRDDRLAKRGVDLWEGTKNQLQGLAKVNDFT
jgi:hypothetical protein